MQVMVTDVSVCSGQFLLGCVVTQEQAHPTAVIDVLCRTWFKSELKHQLLVNDCLPVFWYYSWDCNNSERRMQDVGVWLLWKRTAPAYMTPGFHHTGKPLLLIWPVAASDHGIFLKGHEQCAHLSRTQQLHRPGKILFKEATKISFC